MVISTLCFTPMCVTNATIWFVTWGYSISKSLTFWYMTQLFGDSSKNRKIGIALVTLTTLMFASLDTSAKWLVLSLPVLQVVWMRFFSQVLFTAAVFAPTMGWGMFRVVNLKLQCLRGLILALMTALNFLALQYLQLAETGAIQFSVPILIAVLSSWWLKEKRCCKLDCHLGGVCWCTGHHPTWQPRFSSCYFLKCDERFFVCGVQYVDTPLGS